MMGAKHMATKRTKATTVKRKPAAKPARPPSVGRKIEHGVTHPKDIIIAGTFDDGAYDRLAAAFGTEPQRELTISASRKFLWWEVHRHRVRLKVKAEAHTVTQAPDGAITYSVPLKVDGPCETVLSPWWERTLYAIAGIWS